MPFHGKFFIFTPRLNRDILEPSAKFEERSFIRYRNAEEVKNLQTDTGTIPCTFASIKHYLPRPLRGMAVTTAT